MPPACMILEVQEYPTKIILLEGEINCREYFALLRTWSGTRVIKTQPLLFGINWLIEEISLCY